jgi:hypothetical protein
VSKGARSAIVGLRNRAGRRAPKVIVAAARRLPGGQLLLSALAEEIRPTPRPMDIRPGRFFEPGRGRTLPVVVFVATGLAAGDAEVLAREVEAAQFTTGSFRPLFVVDGAEMRPFRSRELAVEHVMPRGQFEVTNPYDSWNEYLFDRVASIARSYRATSVVPLPPGRAVALPPELLRLAGLGYRA